MSRRCQLDANRADLFFSVLSTFTQKLKLAFRKASTACPANREFLRELEAQFIWPFLTNIDPSLCMELQAVRNEISDLTPSSACSNWLDRLLGNKQKKIMGSYLELLLKSLSATEQITKTELSTKQLLFVQAEFRRMHLEREYMFVPKNEEMHEFYAHYVKLYSYLINPRVGDLVMTGVQRITFPLKIHAVEHLPPRAAIPTFYYAEFFKEYNISFEKDFILYADRRHLRKTNNFSMAFRQWLSILSLIPNESTRIIYFDHRKGLMKNLKDIETRITKLYLQKESFVAVLRWDRDEVSNLVTSFDLIDSLVAFKRLKISMLKIRHMLIEIVDTYQKIFGSL